MDWGDEGKVLSWMTAAFIKISACSIESISGANSSITLARDRPLGDRRGRSCAVTRARRQPGTC